MEFSALFENPELLQLCHAAFLGTVIGIERELRGKDPGLRTFMLISLGSCTFSVISIDAAEGVMNAEPSRIAAQIVVGIGFIGAGAIFRARDKVMGLTTAALMWLTASIGMACGFHRVDLAYFVAIIALVGMFILSLWHDFIRMLSPSRKSVPPANNGSESD